MKKFIYICLIIIIVLVFTSGIVIMKKNTQEAAGEASSVDNIQDSTEYQKIIAPITFQYTQDNDKEGNVYLVNEDTGKRILVDDGLYLYTDDLMDDEDLCRFISKTTHKIGFINTQGTIVIQPKYIKADKMQEGYAVVSENDNNDFFYINDDGEKLNNDTFEEAYNFVNGLARVKFHDNDWAIIRHAQVIVDNCDYINEFDPVEDNLITGVKNGVPVIMKLNLDNYEIEDIKSLDNYSEISKPLYSCFAIVKSKDGYGVLDLTSSEEVIASVWKSIDYEIIDDATWVGSHMRFICLADDGQYSVLEHQF